MKTVICALLVSSSCLFSGYIMAVDDTPVAVDDELVQIIANYQKDINLLLKDEGPYASELGEQLLGLGLIYQLAGVHKNAIGAFKQAFLIQRVNSGLYSLEHTKVIELLLKSYQALGDWQNVNNAYSHLYWLYSRNLKIEDPRWLPVLKRLYAWHLRAEFLDTGENAMEHMEVAQTVYDHGHQIIKDLTNDRQLADCYLESSNANDDCNNKVARLVKAVPDGES